MALDSSTLIIKYKTDKSDAELLQSLKLHQKTTHAIGGENVSYFNALSGDSKSVYITSTDNFVVIVGMPLILDFIHVNPFNKLFPDSEFYFMFNESISMLNGFVYGKGNVIYRRKYVQDGKYFETYDIQPDFGTPLNEEKEIYEFNTIEEIKHSQNVDYMYGVSDYDISLKFLHSNFIENPIEFLEKLIFNRNVTSELEEYIKNSNSKVETNDIDKIFLGEFKKITKEFKFKKINFEGKNGKIAKDSFYRQFDGFKVYLISDKFISTLPLNYYISIELDVVCDWILDNLEIGSYGIPFFSVKPSVYVKMNEKGNDYIYTRNDLDIASNDFELELPKIKGIIEFLESKKPEELFADEFYYNYFIEKIANNVKTLGEILHKDEINFCLLHYYYTKDKSKFNELVRLLDQVQNDKNKNQRHQIVPRKAIASLY